MVDTYLFDITYNNGLYVAVDNEGNIIYSLDGIDWTLGLTGTIFHAYSLYYNNVLYIAVGDGGNIAYSLNGINWVSKNIDFMGDVFIPTHHPNI